MTTPRNTILTGDAADRLATLEASSIDCVVTSPPYFRLRNYQHQGQLGAEATIDQWVEHLRPVMQQLARVLVPTGTLWLNLGDAYRTAAKAHRASPFCSGLSAWPWRCWRTAGSSATRSSGPRPTPLPPASPTA